jgi:hypothetical protein
VASLDRVSSTIAAFEYNCLLELTKKIFFLCLWRMVIEVKFESLRGGWCSKEVLGTFGVGVWKHIRRGWDKFHNLVHFEVGVGSHVSF